MRVVAGAKIQPEPANPAAFHRWNQLSSKDRARSRPYLSYKGRNRRQSEKASRTTRAGRC